LLWILFVECDGEFIGYVVLCCMMCWEDFIFDGLVEVCELVVVNFFIEYCFWCVVIDFDLINCIMV